ncbi:hypothetical protein J31TS4_04900 [Paenibacillus sp. J31TS4]|uniref:zinc dependent phospholipase C family protein n=1 Tax=Paenibacillus sp. J31TS4 TaxID=2807195 RepID=UPI001B06398B|nr:zinc dependent phospholipase C family protein [Paenibacillus sp. J31TS4]GIP37210.1 hypothetical protein J31TS4_04900 [Paenibacillus sp. J31TS4]
MGSRMMHLLIADQVGRRLAVRNRPLFLLGGIAPDAVPKERSHYFEGDADAGTRTIVYSRFADRCRQSPGDEYLLGYLSHLVADEVWLRTFYLPWLRGAMKEDSSLYPRYHADFRALNSLLLDRYQAYSLQEELTAADGGTELDETPLLDVYVCRTEALGDFAPSASPRPNRLQVFTIEQIERYLEESVELAVRVCAELLPSGSSGESGMPQR